MTRPTHWIVRWSLGEHWGCASFDQRSAARRFAAEKRAAGFFVTFESRRVAVLEQTGPMSSAICTEARAAIAKATGEGAP